jgi:hypothetical protein
MNVGGAKIIYEIRELHFSLLRQTRENIHIEIDMNIFFHGILIFDLLTQILFDSSDTIDYVNLLGFTQISHIYTDFLMKMHSI